MIAQLRGQLARVAEVGGYLVLDVGGVGYRVAVPVPVLVGLPPVGGDLTLVIHTQVREDDISLFGFTSDTELRVFELLLTVSGVGPKVALGLLSALTASDLAQAVATEDVRTLTKVPGVGAKTAQRMVLELREKFAAIGFERKVDALNKGAVVRQRSKADAVADDVVSALINLDYSKAEAQKATDMALEAAVKAGSSADAPPLFQDLLRAALNRLTGGGK